jgi:hypothetical protein
MAKGVSATELAALTSARDKAVRALAVAIAEGRDTAAAAGWGVLRTTFERGSYLARFGLIGAWTEWRLYVPVLQLGVLGLITWVFGPTIGAVATAYLLVFPHVKIVKKAAGEKFRQWLARLVTERAGAITPTIPLVPVPPVDVPLPPSLASFMSVSHFPSVVLNAGEIIFSNVSIADGAAPAQGPAGLVILRYTVRVTLFGFIRIDVFVNAFIQIGPVFAYPEMVKAARQVGFRPMPRFLGWLLAFDRGLSTKEPEAYGFFQPGVGLGAATADPSFPNFVEFRPTLVVQFTRLLAKMLLAPLRPIARLLPRPARERLEALPKRRAESADRYEARHARRALNRYQKTINQQGTRRDRINRKLNNAQFRPRVWRLKRLERKLQSAIDRNEAAKQKITATRFDRRRLDHADRVITDIEAELARLVRRLARVDAKSVAGGSQRRTDRLERARTDLDKAIGAAGDRRREIMKWQADVAASPAGLPAVVQASWLGRLKRWYTKSGKKSGSS